MKRISGLIFLISLAAFVGVGCAFVSHLFEVQTSSPLPSLTMLPTLLLPSSTLAFPSPTPTVLIVTPYLPPTVAETPTALVPRTPQAGEICPGAKPTRLAEGIYAYVLYDPPLPSRVRSGPGSHFGVKGLVSPGEVMRILDGPSCEGGIIWWKIDVKFREMVGWVAEADSQTYFLAPCPAEGHCPPLP